MKSSIFICQISEKVQEEIRNKVIDVLESDGYTESEIKETCKNVMEDRLVNIEEIIDIEPYLQQQNDIEYDVLMAIDEVVMALGEDIDESCSYLVKKFNSDYDSIIEFLENKYRVTFY